MVLSEGAISEMRLFTRKGLWLFSAVTILVAATGVLATVTWLNRQISTARDFIDDHQWKPARQILNRYLKFRPGDAEARVLLARSLFSDNSLPLKTVADEALTCLALIPDSSPESSTARVIEGRAYLLLLLQPDHAENCFKAALKQNPDRIDAHILLWKLYDLTGRWYLTNDHFWKIYDHWEPQGRADLLRDWYMSEFNPGTATSDLDRQLGILLPGEQSSLAVERRRYEAFIAAEPDSSLGFACLAHWFHQQGMTSEALDVIQAAENRAGTTPDPFVIAIHVTLSIERGDFKDAEERFRHWPVDDTGYEYWRVKGLVHDQIQHQNAEARDAYERALSTAAGQSDWLTRHRLAQVLMRLNLTDEAAAMRNRSKELEAEMELDVHIPLRKALADLNSSHTHEQMAEFYDRIGRRREARAWRDVASNLTTR